MKNKLYDSMISDITQEQLKNMFDYDDEKGILIRKRDKYGREYNQPCGNKPTQHGYGALKINGRSYRVHRLIWLFHYGEFPSEFIDHIDGNKMNNRIDNLRTVSNQINNHNNKIRTDNTSGYPNVYWHKGTRKYQVRITVDGKENFIGLYATFSDAILAAMLAKIEHHPSSPAAQEYLRELTLAG